MAVKRKKWRISMRKKEMFVGYMFILPCLIGLAFFFFPMLAQVVRYSFSEIYIPFGERYQLLPRGLDHFRNALFVHPTFVRVLTETIIDLLWNVPLIIFFSLFMAILLNRQFPGRLLVRALFFLPVVLAIPAIQNNIAMMTDMMEGGMGTVHTEVEEQFAGFQAGMLAMMLINFGMPMDLIDFIILAVARIHVVLRSAGVQMIIFLAALQAIPKSMYEVAEVEGATAYETFWKITVPMISPLILTNVMYTIVDNYVNSPVITMANNMAFGAARNFGLSSAFSLISAAAITTIMLISGLLISRKVFYQA